MIEQNLCNFNNLIERIIDLNYVDMIIELSKEAHWLDDMSSKRRKELGAADYDMKIGQLLFWLRFGIKPDDVDEWLFNNLYKKIAKKLIEKKQMKPDAMEQLFNKEK